MYSLTLAFFMLKNNAMKLYAISGLGADYRVFQELQLEVPLEPVHWVDFDQGESIASYAQKLSNQIDTTQPFGLIGVSFGGLIAVELNKILKPEITFLVSSIETAKELKPYHRRTARWNLMKWIPSFMLLPPKGFASFLFGAKYKKLLSEILNDTDLNFVRFALHLFCSWENTLAPANCVAISGDKDKIMPCVIKPNTVVIKGGEHFMIVDRAKEISKVINEKLTQ